MLPCLERGDARKVSDPRFSHFVAPLPVINDQSLYWASCGQIGSLGVLTNLLVIFHPFSCSKFEFTLKGRQETGAICCNVGRVS